MDKLARCIIECSRCSADMLGLSTNPIPVKTAMRILGRDAGEFTFADDTIGRQATGTTEGNAACLWSASGLVES